MNILDEIEKNLHCYRIEIHQRHYPNMMGYRVRLYIKHSSTLACEINYHNDMIVIKWYVYEVYPWDLIEHVAVVMTKGNIDRINTILEDHFGESLDELWAVYDNATITVLPFHITDTTITYL